MMSFDEEEFQRNCKLLSDSVFLNLKTLSMFNKKITIEKMNFVLIIQYDQHPEPAYQWIATSFSDENLMIALDEAKIKLQNKIDLLASTDKSKRH